MLTRLADQAKKVEMAVAINVGYKIPGAPVNQTTAGLLIKIHSCSRSQIFRRRRMSR